MNPERLKHIFDRFRLGEPLQLELARGGKIHETFLARTSRGWFVIQELKPPFNHLTALDAYAVTAHLIGAGFPAPEIFLTDRREPFYSDASGVYRVMRRMPGHVRETLTSPSMAFEAGIMTGRLHSVLKDIDYVPQFHLEGFHDPAFLVQKLLDTARKDPPKATPVAGFIERFRQEVPKYLPSKELPKRPIHGDLKVSNFLWDQEGRPCALLDFDTFMLGAYPVEMADAFRSWCGKKDGPEGRRFDQSLFDAAWRGYRETAPSWTREETAALLHALPLIFLELGVRYLIDYFEETFFSWDPSRYSSRSEHNLHRMTRQWALFDEILSKRTVLEEVLNLRRAL
ncbi:MAG: aminoglycoside phosphotransferase family protein [Deltaproteobacteria bacterium]|nr:aminoglycoside phosphotransferase family protein [Deltaproteobacteria bacterium]